MDSAGVSNAQSLQFFSSSLCDAVYFDELLYPKSHKPCSACLKINNTTSDTILDFWIYPVFWGEKKRESIWQSYDLLGIIWVQLPHHCKFPMQKMAAAIHTVSEAF